MTDNGVLAFSRSDSVTFSKVISGSGDVTMLGPGTLILSASDTYTGGTTVGGGILQLGNAAALGSSSGAAAVSGGATLDLHGYSLGVGALSGAGTINNLSGSSTYTLTVGNGNASGTFSGAIKNTTGAIALTKTGTGTLALGGSDTYTGGTTLTAGQLNINSASALGTGLFTISGGTIGNTSGAAITLSTNNAQTWGGDFTFAGTNDLNLGTGAVAMSSSRTVTVASNNLTVGGVISGSGYSLTKAGAGTLTLTGSDTYTGTTTISGGTLQIGAGGAAGSINGTSGVTDNGVLAFSRSDSVTFSKVISGSGDVTMLGPGTLILSASDTYTGGTTVGGGILQLGNAAALGSSSGAAAVSGGATLDLHGYSLGVGGLSGGGLIDNRSGTGTYTLTVGNGNASSTFSGTIQDTSGTIALTKTGTGTLVLAGADTYIGGTTISGGTLLLNNAAAVQRSTVTVSTSNGLGFGTGITTFTLGGLAGSSSFALADSTGAGVAVQVGNNNASTSYSGVLSGSGSLTKIGTGVLTLAGADTYTGGTTIGGGTLQLGNAAALGPTSDNLAVSGGATLDLHGYSLGVGALSGAGTINNLSGSSTYTLTVGNGNASSTFSGAIKNTTGAIALAKTGTGTLALGGSDTYTGGTTLTAGQLNINSASALGTGLFTISGGTIGNTSGAAITLSTNNAQTWGGDFTFAGTNDLNLGTGAVAMSSSRTVTVASNNLTVGGVVSGSGYSLTKAGAGTLTLAGADTYTGGTTIGGGTLQLGNAAALGPTSDNLTVSSGATLDLHGYSLGVGGLSGGGLIDNRSGTGVYTLTVGNGNASSTFSGTIQDTFGTIALTKTGTGTLTLAGADTYIGGTTISGGTLLLNNAAAVQDSTVTVSTSNGLRFGTGITTFTLGGLAGSSSFVLADSTGAGVAVQVGNNNASTSYSGVLSGSGSLTKIGTGVLTLAGADTYTGGTTIGGGTLQLGNAAALGPTSDNLTVSSGATLDLHGYSLGVGGLSGGGLIDNRSGTGVYTLTVGNGNASGTFSGTIQDTSGTIALTKTGTGTLTLAGADMYIGGTTISGGTLLLNNAAAVQDSTVTVSTSNGLRFGTGITTFTLGGLAGSSSFALANSTGAGVAVQVGNNNASTSYSGVLSGSGSLTKIGTGVLTLGAENTYTGGTIVSAGTLALNVGGPIGTVAPGSTVTVNAGAVLQANHTDVLGYNYNSNNAANLIVNDGTVYVSSGYRLTLSNTVVMTGGTLSSGTGHGDGSGNYSLDGQINATSDANGNPAVINATQIGLQFSPSVFNVTRGPANPASDLIISSVISSWYDGTGLTKTGNGILTLSGSNTYDGGTTLSAGQLNINNASALGTGTFTISGGTIGNSSGAAITLSTNNAQEWDGNFAFVGPNDLNLGTGPVALDASIIVTVTAADLTVGGPISDGYECNCCGPYSLTKAGAGTLTLSGSNSFDGGMFLTAGRLNINNASALGTGTFTISGGTIGNTSGHAITLSTNNAQSWNGDFYFVGSNDLNLGTGTVTLGGNRTVTVTADDLTVGGQISGGSYGLTKAGAGTLTLTGSSTYRGITTINGGLLAVDGSLRTSGSVTVNNTGILGGTGRVGNVVVNSGGTVMPGTGGEGTLSMTSLSLSTGSVLDYVLGTGTGHDGFLAVSGRVSLPGSGVTLNLTDGGFLTAGTYHLMSYGSLSGTPSAAFTIGVTPPSVAGDQFSFQTETGSTNYLDLVILATTTSGEWIAPGSGSWAIGTNWENGFIPTKEGDTATFGTSIGTMRPRSP